MQCLLQEIGAGPVEQYIAAGDGRGHGVGPGLDAVGQHGVIGAVQVSRPWIHKVDVPSPSMRAPILIRQLATSTTSGSRAAFSIRLSPLASTAAIRALCVAPTETLESVTLLPVSPRGARAMT